jgi:plasmid stabilization system protein ParE
MLIRWRPRAFDDLKTISSHIERQRNLATANRVCRIIYDTIQTLRRFPESGKIGIEEGTPLLRAMRITR